MDETPSTGLAENTGAVPHPRQESQTRRTSKVTAILLLGDAVAFLIFAIVGRRSHGESAGLDTFSYVAGTAAPFFLGWCIACLATGNFRATMRRSLAATLRLTTLTWLLGWPLALLFRGLVERRVPPLSFAIVTLLTNMILLLVWRGLAHRLLGHPERTPKIS